MYATTYIVIGLRVLAAFLFWLTACLRKNLNRYARKYYIAAQERDIMACDANKQARYVRILKQSLRRVALRGGPRIIRR